MTNFSLIAAMDEANGIGKKGVLPWRLKEELAYFTKMTKGGGRNVVIMGRTTWESLPAKHRPLAERVNIVLSRDKKMALPLDVLHATNFEEALEKAAKTHPEQIFVIGGAKVYAEAIAHAGCSTLYITRVESTFECDAFFPHVDEKQFVKIFSSPDHSENKVNFRFEKYRRVS